MTLLPIEIPHLHQLVQLPFHHRDPFDRLLIAQGVSEDLPLSAAIRYLMLTWYSDCGIDPG